MAWMILGFLLLLRKEQSDPRNDLSLRGFVAVVEGEGQFLYNTSPEQLLQPPTPPPKLQVTEASASSTEA